VIIGVIMLTMILANELDADRRRVHRRRERGLQSRRSVREFVGMGLVTIGLRLASPERGAAAYLARA
jgi:hypothetical protein